MGKALGGGMMPVSAFLAKKEVMELFKPGSHGSTFGGNPLAAAVGLRALELLEEPIIAAPIVIAPPIKAFVACFFFCSSS